MVDNKKAIIVLDYHSKQLINRSISDFSKSGIIFVTALNEIDSSMLSITNTVIIFEGFFHIQNPIENLKVYKKLLNLDIIYIGNKLDILSELNIKIFICDIGLLDYNTIQGALSNDKYYSSNDNTTYEVFSEMSIYANDIIDSDDYDNSTRQLATSFLTLYNNLKKLKKENELLKEDNSIIKAKTLILEEENRKYLEGYTSLLKDAYKLNETLWQYEGILTKDIYSKLNVTNYPNRPYIVYLKEYQELYHQDTFIDTLFEIFHLQQQKSVKVLRLYDSRTIKSMYMLPEHYYRIGNSYYNKDIIINDFLAKSGDYEKILDLLLTNRSDLNVLIIVDCKSANDIVLTGPIMNINLCRKSEHLSIFNLSDKNTVCCTKDSYLEWGNYDLNGYDLDDKFLFLSSREVFKRILGLIDIFNSTI